MVEVAGKPILTHCFEQLVDLGATELVVVVGYLKQRIIDHYGDDFQGVPITYAHQCEQRGLAHALLEVDTVGCTGVKMLATSGANSVNDAQPTVSVRPHVDPIHSFEVLDVPREHRFVVDDGGRGDDAVALADRPALALEGAV